MIKIYPSLLSGSISPPPSKSLAHRALIAAALAKGVSLISNIEMSDDILATADALRSMGAKLDIEENGDILVDGRGTISETDVFIDCKESGSTMRFFIPIALAKGASLKMHGEGFLSKRPLEPFYPLLLQNDISFEKKAGDMLDFRASGRLKGGEYSISGDVSSQFITGLLFALPLAETDSVIKITTPLESRGYIALTLDVLKAFGIDVINKDYKEFIISGKQEYRAVDYRVESDFSQAAFFLSAAAIGSDVKTMNMNLASLQGDRLVINHLRALGYNVDMAPSGELGISAKAPMGGVIDGSQCPDIIPILAVVAALTPGKTEIVGAGRLRIKECDRLAAMAENLLKLGANVRENEDGLTIIGVAEFKPASVSSFADHRIAMCMAIASSRVVGGELLLDNPECVRKSYPNFWQDFKMLGGKVS